MDPLIFIVKAVLFVSVLAKYRLLPSRMEANTVRSPTDAAD